MAKLAKKTFNSLAHLFGYEFIKQKHMITPKEGYHYVPDIYGKSHRKLRDFRADELFTALADEARRDKRTLLYYDRLFTLYQAIENLGRNTAPDAPINMVEAGVYKGGGSYFMARCAEKMLSGHPIRLFAVDTFSGHDAADIPKGRDGDHLPGQFSETSYEDVKNYLSRFSCVEVIQARIQDAVDKLEAETFHLIHIDVDIYEPTKFSLHYFESRLSPSGMIVIDDYGFNSCTGLRQAVDEYLQERPGHFAKFELLTGQCLLVKQGA